MQPFSARSTHRPFDRVALTSDLRSISGLVAEYIVAIDVTRVRFPADALHSSLNCIPMLFEKMVPRGLEPRTLRLLAVRSNQLSYETTDGLVHGT